MARFAGWSRRALRVESDGFVEVVDLEGHAAEQVWQAREVKLVAGGICVFEQAPVVLECALVVAASQSGVAQVIQREAYQITGMLAAR
jgi:hypothetical protein